MDRCPSCRARLNESPLESPLCPRCGCDLTLVLRAERQAQNLLRRGIQAWAAGDPTRATTQLDASLRLKRGKLAAVLAAMLAARHAGAGRGGQGVGIMRRLSEIRAHLLGRL